MGCKLSGAFFQMSMFHRRAEQQCNPARISAAQPIAPSSRR
jgi:hypothetical protein